MKLGEADVIWSRDGVDVAAAHEAFLGIDEYRQTISPTAQRSQRCNVLFGQTLPFAIKVHPLIAPNAALKPLTQASISTLRVMFER